MISQYSGMIQWLWLVPSLPLISALFNGIWGKRLSKTLVSLIACLSVLGSFLISLGAWSQLASLPEGRADFRLWSWIPVGRFQVDVGLLFDPLSAVMALVVSGVSFLIHVYSIGYMYEDPLFSRYFTYLNLFVGSMLTLVLANNFLLMFVGWELVGLCSYLLIGFWFQRETAALAGKKAFLVNRVGDFGFALGMMLIFSTFGSLHFQTVFSQAEAVHRSAPLVITVITLLLFMGATGKSAQLPLYVWLPDAMEGPTPVSALIHAATMVTAGVYMVARCHALYDLAPLSANVVATVGALTALFSASIGMTQYDIKRVLAYSTISQLGYMFLAVGLGAYVAGIFHLMTHAFFKALLFLGAGSVMHALANETDIRKMGGLKDKIPITHWTFLIGTLAIAGAPPLSGFISKDEILLSAFEGNKVLWAIAWITAGMTAFYMFRLYYRTFWGQSRVPQEVEHHVHEAPPSMTIPLVVLAIFSLIGGFVGLPSWMGFPNAFEHFLHSTLLRGSVSGVHTSAGIGLFVMLSSVAIAVIGWWSAHRLYILDPSFTLADQLKRKLGGVYTSALNKWYVDEFYQAVIVRPGVNLATVLAEVFDAMIIDGLVNLVAALVALLGEAWRTFQSGYVRWYAWSILGGAVLLLGWFLMR